MSASRLVHLLALAPLGFAVAACSDTDASGSGSVLAQPANSKETFGEVAPFTLTERNGQNVTRETLLGNRGSRVSSSRAAPARAPSSRAI